MRAAPTPLAAVLLALTAAPLGAAEVPAGAPEAVSVTVYRAPNRNGPLVLEDLQGFALITETRSVTLPAGESTLRFEGVAGGIEAQSALVTGFPQGVIEKNRDAHVLSPASLVAAALHQPVLLERTDPTSGQMTRTPGTIESNADGVVFVSAEGFEALRCSGLPETFGFEPSAGAQAVPTLSVRVRSAAPVTRRITLSYLAQGFDWSASYAAHWSADGKTLDLGAWVTLANGNGESFAQAHTQVVAGRLHREAPAGNDGAPAAGAVLAQCWPRGSTSDAPPERLTPLALKKAAPMRLMRSLAAPAAAQDAVVTAARQVVQEQLGDLKLYRVPDLTTLAARQMKQVRLMDQFAVPVREVCVVHVPDGVAQGDEDDALPVEHQLRTRNTRANHLGLPLPAGSLALYARGAGDAPLLLSETSMKDHAVDEDVTIGLGAPSQLTVTVSTDRRRAADPAGAAVPLLPGLALRRAAPQVSRRVTITSTRPQVTEVEVQLDLVPGTQVVRADRPLLHQNGRPTFHVRVPALDHTVLRYTTAAPRDQRVRPR